MDQRTWRRWAAGLVAGMIILNLAVGALAYHYLGEVDANYTRLLNEGIPFLNSMQSVTAQASRAYTVLVDLSQAEKPDDIARLEDDLKAVRKVSDDIFASERNAVAVPPKLKPAYEDLIAMRKSGRDRTQHFLELVRAHQLSEARVFLRNDVYAGQKAYLTKLDHFCDDYQETFAALNRQLIDQNSLSRSLLFGLAAVPAALLFAAIALLVAGVSVLLIVALRPSFRSKA
jgi:hypothetical protein